jgi:hypothetical protein
MLRQIHISELALHKVHYITVNCTPGWIIQLIIAETTHQYLKHYTIIHIYINAHISMYTQKPS